MNQARLAGGGRSEVAQYHIDPLGEHRQRGVLTTCQIRKVVALLGRRTEMLRERSCQIRKVVALLGRRTEMLRERGRGVGVARGEDVCHVVNGDPLRLDRVHLRYK